MSKYLTEYTIGQMLANLFVSDVESSGYKKSSNIYKLTEDTAFRWSEEKTLFEWIKRKMTQDMQYI